jgi:hypothetical protein
VRGIIAVSQHINNKSAEQSYYYYYYVSCHMPILPGNSLEPTVIPTAQASSFTVQYFPYYVPNTAVFF